MYLFIKNLFCTFAKAVFLQAKKSPATVSPRFEPSAEPWNRSVIHSPESCCLPPLSVPPEP